MSGRPFAVVTGGGTGGHVSPALAVAEALVARGHEPSEIEFVAGRHGIESRLVPEAGFRLHRLPGKGIKRSASLSNLSAAAGLLGAFLAAVVMAGRRRPRVVVTVGGYAGLPYALAAVLWRIPLLVVSFDAVPGAANRLAGRFATCAAVSYPGTPLPRAVVTGPPVRRQVLELERSAPARSATMARLGLDPARRLVVVTGGSLGAGRLNTAAIGAAARLAGRGDLALYHLCGERNLAEARAAATAAGLDGLDPAGLEYRLTGFDPALGAAMAASELVVSRAGASTVAELTTIGVASVLVPLPGAPGDHQAKNAAVLEREGAAVVLADGTCTPERLAEVIDGLLASGKLAEMGEAARRLGRPGAADEIARLAEELASRTRRRRSR